MEEGSKGVEEKPMKNLNRLNEKSGKATFLLLFYSFFFVVELC